MKQLYTALSCLLTVCLLHTNLAAQCPAGLAELVVKVRSDGYPNEITWNVANAAGTVLLSGAPSQPNTLYIDSLCIDTGSCHTFHIHDTYGDGLLGAGYYAVYLNGSLIDSSGDYSYDAYASFSCPPGASCTDPLNATSPGSYTASSADIWYTFTPDSSGLYTISTCSTNTCNTVIWIYDHCNGLVWDNTNAGTTAYNDDACGTQAEVSTHLLAGQTYFIRIGTTAGSCTGAINWSIDGPVPVPGCMDPTACNYNPLATVSDNSCIPFGDPGCGVGPDLKVLQDVLINSMYASNYTADNCAVQEHCLAGYGSRRIIRFTTHIQNIGELDYYIGNPGNNPGQFTFNNCHGHPHYEGYAEYVLFKEDGTVLPIGFKNGFCVIDLECWNGGNDQYGCSNMGISAGCGDYYSAGLTCQWIDITDVDTGNYVLVVRVNWDQSADALGHYETDYNNNWAQVCININETNGVKNFTVDTACAPYVDCTGQIYGNAQPDCDGNCNGTKKRGDLDNNGMFNLFDINAYVAGILNQNLTAAPCNDLNADGLITVYDASLINDCTLYGSNAPLPAGGFYDYCAFPQGVFNFNDTMFFTLGDVNTAEQYVDVLVRNTSVDLNAYEFVMQGLSIDHVVSIADGDDYAQAYPQADGGGTRVVCYSSVDSSLGKSAVYQPLCRVYYESIEEEVCISEVTEVVNSRNEKAVGKTEDACRALSTYVSNLEASQRIDVMPNPASGFVHVRFTLPTADPFIVSITNALGQIVYTQERSGALLFNEQIDLSFLPAGSYTLKVNGSAVNAGRKIVVIR